MLRHFLQGKFLPFVFRESRQGATVPGTGGGGEGEGGGARVGAGVGAGVGARVGALVGTPEEAVGHVLHDSWQRAMSVAYCELVQWPLRALATQY